MLIVQNDVTRVLVWLMVSSTDHVTPVTGLSPAVTLSKNGGAFASPAGVVAEIGSGWYRLTPGAADVATLGMLILHASGAGADPADALVEVVAANVHDNTSLGLSRIDATISSIPVGLATGAEIAALNDLSIADVQTALTNQGYTVARAALLDSLSNLDAAISSVLFAISGLNNLSGADVQSALTTQGLTTTRAGNLDRLDASITSTVDLVWNALVADHQNVGSTGKALSDAGGGSSPSEIAAAVLAANVEGVLTLKDATRLTLARLVAKRVFDVGRPITMSFRDTTDTKNRIVIEYDNESINQVTLDPS